MIHPGGWQVRLSPHDTGTGVMTYDPKTGVGMSIQPLCRDDTSLPGSLIVGCYFPSGKLLFTNALERGIEAEAKKDMGSEYSVSVKHVKMAQLEGIELVLMKAAR